MGSFVFPFERSLGRSPTGSVRADRTSFEAGEVVDFVVTLDPANVNFPVLGYNVKRVRVYRRGAGSLILAYEVPAARGQTEYHVPWAATVDGEVGSNFIAFVETKMPGVPLLEIGVAEPSEPGFATFELTYEETKDYEWQEDEDYSRRHSKYTARYELLLDGLTGEVVSGTFVDEWESRYESFFKDTRNELCPFTTLHKREESGRSTGQPASGEVGIELTGGGTSYSLYGDNDDWPAVTTYRHVETWVVDSVGPGEDCDTPPPDIDEVGSDEVRVTLPGAGGPVTWDLSAPVWSDEIVKSETDTDETGTTTETTTVRWSMTRP